MLNSEDDGKRTCVLVTNNEVHPDVAKGLIAQGHRRGDPGFESHGIFQRVTQPRCRAVVTGNRPDGTPIPGNHIGARPLADGFPENVAFYRLTYQEPESVEIGAQFVAIAPCLHRIAGGFGAVIAEEDRGTGYALPDDARYGVLFSDRAAASFSVALDGRPDVRCAFIVTDSPESFRELRGMLPAHVTETHHLYREYLQNFRLHAGSEIA